MPISDDLRKTLTDPTPLYAAVGTADLAAEKLKEVPTLLEKLRTERIAAVRATDPKAVQERMTKQAKEAQATVQGKLNEVFGTLDTDLKKFREQAQGLALQGVGKAAEYAVKARETYDEMATRGQRAVKTWRGEAAEEITEIAVAVEPSPEPKPEPAVDETLQGQTAASTQSKKTAAPGARKATSKKTAPKPAE
jgi:heparin binding hemagglutinin HbhA